MFSEYFNIGITYLNSLPNGATVKGNKFKTFDNGRQEHTNFRKNSCYKEHSPYFENTVYVMQNYTRLMERFHWSISVHRFRIVTRPAGPKNQNHCSSFMMKQVRILRYLSLKVTRSLWQSQEPIIVPCGSFTVQEKDIVSQYNQDILLATRSV